MGIWGLHVKESVNVIYQNSMSLWQIKSSLSLFTFHYKFLNIKQHNDHLTLFSSD